MTIVVIIPWEGMGLHMSRIKVVKMNITLQVYKNKWHMYMGFMILNLSMCVQIDQSVMSCSH